MGDLPKLSLVDTVRGLRGIAAAKPDKVYKIPRGSYSCKYIHGKKTPGCIVGALALRSGVDLAYLLKHNDTDARRLDIWGSSEARVFACEVQKLQDRGTPWRDAFNTVLAQRPVEGVEAIA